MTQESLIQYLKTYLVENIDDIEHDELEKQLQSFVRKKTAADLLNDYDHHLATALKDVKICDPAIGSGAFPMGLLNEIFQCMYVLYFASPDVVGEIWEMEKWEPGTVKKNIIQHSIYGVDIEMGAVDTARLRFWLSLIVDEEKPSPLPNLDYKIMQGNSLLESFEGIPLDNMMQPIKVSYANEDGQLDMFGKTTQNENHVLKNEQQKQLEILLEEYFACADLKRKEEIHDEINTIVKDHIEYNIELEENKVQIQITELEKNINAIKFYDRDTKAVQVKKQKTIEKLNKELLKQRDLLSGFQKARTNLEDIQCSNEKPYFLWHLFFKDVFDKDGFDIVIGNPPYIQLQKDGGYLAKLYETIGYDTFNRMGDIYSLFYEKGFQILKENGTHTFITSSQWMKAAYGKPLRAYFLKQNLQKLVLLGPAAFENATVDTNILIAKKGENGCNLQGTIINYKKQLTNLAGSIFMEMPYVNGEQWAVVSAIQQSLNQKISKNGKQLIDWDVEIYFGIKTGYNEAFIINQSKRDELVKLDSINDEIIKPILKGRGIEKYITIWNQDYINFIPWHFPLHNDVTIKGSSLKAEGEFKTKFKALYNFLEEHKTGLSNRNKAETGIRYEWYALQRCAATYKEEFTKEKVIWKRIGSQLRFSYSDEEIYCLDSTCIATGEKIKYLTGLLNSKISHYQLFENAPRTGMGDLIISVQALEPLYVHYPNEKTEEIIVEIVDEIIELKKKGENTSHLENQIDVLAFKLYNLSYEEVLVIEPNFWLSKEEYEKIEIE
jgi:adenine-specific DNA-methyltransferase